MHVMSPGTSKKNCKVDLYSKIVYYAVIPLLIYISHSALTVIFPNIFRLHYETTYACDSLSIANPLHRLLR